MTMVDGHFQQRSRGAISQENNYMLGPGWHDALPTAHSDFEGEFAHLRTDGKTYVCRKHGVGHIWVAVGDAVPGTQVVPIVLGDGVSAIAAGIHKDVPLPSAGTWTKWQLFGTKFNAGSAGDLVVDVGVDRYANFPPTFPTDSITGTDKPTLSADDENESTALTGWTTQFLAGDTLRVNVESGATVRQATLVLHYTPISVSAAAIALTLGDGVAVIPTGIALDFTMAVAGTWTEWMLLATKPDNTPGSVVADIWSQAYAGFPAENAQSIAGTDLPTLTAAVKNRSTALTGWDTGFSAGDTFRINVDSAATLKLVTLILFYQRAS